MTLEMTCQWCGESRAFEYSQGDRSGYCWREDCRHRRAAAIAGAHEQNASENPIRAVAEALNPPGGALADALPFALERQVSHIEQPALEQPDLFPGTDEE